MHFCFKGAPFIFYLFEYWLKVLGLNIYIFFALGLIKYEKPIKSIGILFTSEGKKKIKHSVTFFTSFHLNAML